MLTKKRYSVKDMVFWTRKEALSLTLYATFVTILFDVLDFSFFNLPWTPIALIGTAVAFVIGFQNNSAYGRIWEARKIWGGIVNTSRTWGMKTMVMINNDHTENPLSEEELYQEKKTIIHRHVAWLTALRHAMREGRSWEVFNQAKTNREWSEMIYIPEVVSSLEDELYPYLTDEERVHAMSHKNKATTLLYLQSKHINELKDKGAIWPFAFLDLEKLLEEMFTLQGKSERIKNFPYPRQYATLSTYFVWIFLALLPFGIVPEFEKISAHFQESYPFIASFFVWLAIPFCAVVSWVFYTMERIGRVGENPFEGSGNDVPISTIARGIEIDIRQQLGESLDDIPKPFPEQYNVQM